MWIGRLARSFVTDPAFTAGDLHDIGKLVLALRMPVKFTQVIQRIAETGEDHQSVEREILGVGHADVGGYLMMAWGIPTSLIESVAFHHRPGAVSSGNRKVLAAVDAADALYGFVSCGEPETRLDLGFLESVGLSGKWRAGAPSSRRKMQREPTIGVVCR